MKRPFDTKDLRYLAENAGFASTGNPYSAALFLKRLLSLTPFYENRAAVDQLLPNSGLQHLVLNFVTQLDLLEHGGSIGGSWLTNEGEQFLHNLNTIDWDQPPANCGTFVQLISPASKPSRSRLPYWQIFEQLDFCACGQPWDLLAFLHRVLRDRAIGGDLSSLVPEPGLRQFLSYQLTFRGLTCSEGKLTDLARSVVTRLDLVEQDGYEEPELD